MVGTTRFELATSPTPRVRSTRLSHVPTIGLRVTQAGDGGVYCSSQCTRLARFDAHIPSGSAQHTPSATIHLHQRKTRSSAPPETLAPPVSTAAGDTHSATSSAVPPTRPTTSSKHSCKSSAQSQNRTAVHPVLPFRP